MYNHHIEILKKLEKFGFGKWDDKVVEVVRKQNSLPYIIYHKAGSGRWGEFTRLLYAMNDCRVITALAFIDESRVLIWGGFSTLHHLCICHPDIAGISAKWLLLNIDAIGKREFPYIGVNHGFNALELMQVLRLEQSSIQGAFKQV